MAFSNQNFKGKINQKVLETKYQLGQRQTLILIMMMTTLTKHSFKYIWSKELRKLVPFYENIFAFCV